MGIENYIEFGGVKSSDYDIYVSGEGVFKSAERDVEFVEIPGRDGEFALDKNRFKNAEVPYRVINQEADLTDFRTKLSAFRNAMLSKKGYQRLEDTFHPDEFRMGVYAGPMDIEPILYNTASEFELKFNCKPQRYLKSGETEVTVASGGAITNPTLFNSKPILLVTGYGDIDINGEMITVDDVPIGEFIVSDEQTKDGFGSVSVPIPSSKLNTGDAITVGSCVASIELSTILGSTIESISLTKGTEDIASSSSYGIRSDRMLARCNFEFDSASFQYGTNEQKTTEYTVSVTLTRSDSVTVTESFTLTFMESLTGDSMVISISKTGSNNYFTANAGLNIETIKADSTKSALGDPMYIDMDIGEAYKVEDGELISVDSAVQLPPDLIELIPGGNTITYDNTITSFKIIPRWWRT